MPNHETYQNRPSENAACPDQVPSISGLGCPFRPHLRFVDDMRVKLALVIIFQVERVNLARFDAGRHFLAAAKIALDDGLPGRIQVYRPVWTRRNAHQTTVAELEVMYDRTVRVLGEGAGGARCYAFRFIAMMA